MQIFGTNESVYIRKEFNSHGIGLEPQHGLVLLFWNTIMAAVLLFWNTNMAAVMCFENAYCFTMQSRFPELIFVSDQL